MKPKLKKALKIIGIVLALIGVSFIGLILYVSSQPQAPPFDDSKLAVNRPDVPKSENGFLLFSKTVGKPGDPISREHFFDDITGIKDNEFRNLSENDFEKLNKKYGNSLKSLEDSMNYKYLIAPERKLTKDNKLPPEAQYYNAVLLSRLNLSFARYDFRHDKPERGIKRLESTLRTGMRLQNAYGSILQYSVGASIKSRCLEEIDALLDQNLIKDDQLSSLLKTINDNRNDITGFRRTLAVEYNFTKNAKRILMSDIGKGRWVFIDKAFFYLNFDEKKTLKGFYDFYSTLYDWAGKPYSMRPKQFEKKSDDSFYDFIQSFLLGNLIGEQLVTSAKYNISSILSNKLSFHETQKNVLCTKIALLRYFNDNNKLPKTLEALVPEYIPAVPRDPFDGKPLRYNPEKKIVYSVGYNLKDDDGVSTKHIFDLRTNNPRDQKDLMLFILKINPPVKE